MMHWLNYHFRAIILALHELVQSPIATIITLCVIGIGVTLPLGFYIILKNVESLHQHWRSEAPTMSLYIRPNTLPSETDAFIKQLQMNSGVAEVSYVSPEDGLKTFEAATKLNHLSSLFDKNPLPGVIVILPTVENQTPDTMQTLFQTLKASPLVVDAQIDIDWVNRLYYFIDIGKRVTHVLVILFGAGIILIISSALRASIFNHKTEIQILQLMGATNAYIRRPLLYRGVLYAVFGGLIAWILTTLFTWELESPVAQLANTYQSHFQLQGLSLVDGLSMLLICILLGFMGSWFIVQHVLNSEGSASDRKL